MRFGGQEFSLVVLASASQVQVPEFDPQYQQQQQQKSGFFNTLEHYSAMKDKLETFLHG